MGQSHTKTESFDSVNTKHDADSSTKFLKMRRIIPRDEYERKYNEFRSTLATNVDFNSKLNKETSQLESELQNLNQKIVNANDGISEKKHDMDLIKQYIENMKILYRHEQNRITLFVIFNILVWIGLFIMVYS